MVVAVVIPFCTDIHGNWHDMSAGVVMNIFIWNVMCGLRYNKTVEYNPRGEKSQKNKHIVSRVFDTLYYTIGCFYTQRGQLLTA